MCTQYTGHKYIEHDPSKPTATSMMEKGSTSMSMYKQQVVAIEFLRRREHKPSASASRIIVRLIVLDYKRAR